MRQIAILRAERADRQIRNSLPRNCTRCLFFSVLSCTPPTLRIACDRRAFKKLLARKRETRIHTKAQSIAPHQLTKGKKNISTNFSLVQTNLQLGRATSVSARAVSGRMYERSSADNMLGSMPRTSKKGGSSSKRSSRPEIARVEDTDPTLRSIQPAEPFRDTRGQLRDDRLIVYKGQERAYMNNFREIRCGRAYIHALSFFSDATDVTLFRDAFHCYWQHAEHK